MANIFDKLLADAMRSGRGPKETTKSLDWFQKRIGVIGRNVKPIEVMRDPEKLRSTHQWGFMYMFFYDPKHKATLPYYDAFPLVFPIQMAKKGFLGINLHYLPYFHRARLMDALYTLRNNQRMDETTKLNLSYQILNSTTKYAYFKPCIKHYLTSHIKSRFLRVESVEWPIALFLPLERFQKETKEFVWQEVRKSL